MSRAEHPTYGGTSYLTPLLWQDVATVSGVLLLMTIEAPNSLGWLIAFLFVLSLSAGINALPPWRGGAAHEDTPT